MNSLPLSSLVISYATYKENRYLQVLYNTVALTSYLGLLRALQKLF